jgi:hypothetical protein
MRAVKADARGIAGVAERIGFSRPAVSQVLNGVYPADPAKIAQAVLDHYDHPRCPLVGGDEIDRAVCRRKALRPEPFGGQVLRANWGVCQSCSFKPNA